MDNKRQEKVYELLKRGLKIVEMGEEIPMEWSRELFPPERREYELVYNGKEAEGNILADTIAVPFQEVSTFGQNSNDWHNRLIFGDNLQAMKTLLRMKEEGKLLNADGTPGIRLIYIDPPFATKRDFKGTQDQKAYQDKIAGAEFLEFLRKRLVIMRNLLSDDGSIYIHIDWKKGHYLKVLMDEIFGEQNFRREIIWALKGAAGFKSLVNSFVRGHDTILYYSKSSNVVFNKEYLPYNDEQLKRFTSDGKGRKYKSITKEKRLYLDEAKGVPVTDVWTDIASFQTIVNSPEITGYPTQKPEALINRIIQASSNKGDIVFDAFVGAGTTPAVAEKLNRRWIAVDIGKFAIYTTQKRMLTLRKNIGQTGEKIKPKPFTLYNAGLYDFENLRNLPWEDWRFFALQLFQCKDEPHKIHGFQMDGKRQGSSVYVFNHFDKGMVSRETISDLNASIGNVVGDRCFIIAPRGVFLFQEDYIEIGKVRYYALRIPYSFINELHRDPFSPLIQPNDELAVNETVEAVGFDFIQLPIVDLEIVSTKKVFSAKITKFESKARLRGTETVNKHDSLSMVMVDKNYNGKVFNLDNAYYANLLKTNKWKIDLPIEEIKGNVMFVFLDIYGNEARISITPKEYSTKEDQQLCQGEIK